MKEKLNDEQMKQVIGGNSNPAPTPTGGNPAAVARAMQEIGKPYAWGAAGPEAYDCSGLVSFCLTGVHCHIGTVSDFMAWPRVSDPQPGDVCVNAGHCGIYVAPGSMIHAPTVGALVSYGGIQGDMIIVRQP